MKKLNLLTIGSLSLLVLSFSPGEARAVGSVGNPSSAPLSLQSSPGEAANKSVEKKIAKLNTALGLTPEERSKIELLLLQEAGTVKTLRLDKTLSKADHAAKLKLIHAETKARIAAVLNPTQQTKFAEMGPGHHASPMNKT